MNAVTSFCRRGFVLAVAVGVIGLAPSMALAAVDVKLTLNAATNGYKAKVSASGTAVTCHGVQDPSSKALLNGDYETTVTYDDKTTETKKVTYKNGDADFGFVPRNKTVAKVKVSVP